MAYKSRVEKTVITTARLNRDVRILWKIMAYKITVKTSIAMLSTAT